MMQNADKQAIFRMYPLPSDIIPLLPSPRLSIVLRVFRVKTRAPISTDLLSFVSEIQGVKMVIGCY